MWYLEVAILGLAVPIFLRGYQDKLKPLLRESYQSLFLSLIWLGTQLAAPGRPSNMKIMLGWLFIYSFGTLALLFGRMDE